MRKILFGPKLDWVQDISAAIDATRFTISFEEPPSDPAALAAFDAVVPLQLADYAPLYPHKDDGAGNFIIPDKETVAIAHDKLLLNRFLTAHGLARHIPTIFDSTEEYPFIYKKREDEWGLNSIIIRTREDELAFEQTIDTALYFKQQYVEGRTEYTTHILAYAGSIKFLQTIAYEFDQDLFVKGRASSPVSTSLQPTLYADLFAKLISLMRYSGTCCINYKVEKSVPRIFEINPRFGSSLCPLVNAYLDAYVPLLADAGRDDRRAMPF